MVLRIWNRLSLLLNLGVKRLSGMTRNCNDNHLKCTREEVNLFMLHIYNHVASYKLTE